MKRIFPLNAMMTIKSKKDGLSRTKSVGMVEFDLDEVDSIIIPVNYDCEVSTQINENESLHGDADVIFSFREICDLLGNDSFSNPVELTRNNRFKDKFDLAIDLIYMKLVLE